MRMTFKHSYEILQELLLMLDGKLDSYDGFLYDAMNVPDMAESTGGFGFEDLRPYIDTIKDDGVAGSPLST
jgi:hypothetical protein